MKLSYARKIDILAGLMLIVCMAVIYRLIKPTPPAAPVAHTSVVVPAVKVPVAVTKPVVDCKVATSTWNPDCLNYGSTPLTPAQKMTRFNDCSVYASRVATELMNKMHSLNNDDRVTIASIHTNLLKLCVIEGRDKFPSDDQLDQTFNKFDR